MQRIISLSTIPPRFRLIEPTLRSLLRQSMPADEVRLYIPRSYRRFPDYDGSLPDLPPGITLCRPAEDLGPASKILFAADELRERDCQILFCDDDRIYQPDWARFLFEHQARRPRECVSLVGKPIHRPKTAAGRRRRRREERRSPQKAGFAKPLLNPRRAALHIADFFARTWKPADARVLQRSRIYRAGHAEILQGYGGVAVRPHFFDASAKVIPDIIWAVDDYWLSGLLASRNIPIWLPAHAPMPLKSATSGVESLLESEIDGSGRTEANQACIDYMRARYGIWN
ncbi:hypothetical protein GCM10011390_15380 [Aureimonas endophytica]|uniref:Glycosyl transferase family 2 n=1 Tax=Aureimonas endophytica TaxID=2027858 RepID=A0A917E3E2_9HYPH|nr:hypothetical protein GCM10011390_15380 [Aureimonas endophytica]